MSPVLERIEKEASQLPAIERELLANHLFQSVHPDLTDVDKAWLVLADKRYQALKSGKEKALSEDEFFSSIEKDMGWK